MEDPAGAAFIITGPKDDASSTGFRRVGSAFRRKGVNPEYIEPSYEGDLPGTIESVEEEVRERLDNYGSPGIYFFGHSTGAVIAIVASTRFSPRAQVLASMPPVFSEDKAALPLTYRALGKVKKLFGKSARGFNYSLQDLSGKETGYKHLVYSGSEFAGFHGYGKHVSGPRMSALEDAREKVVDDAKKSLASEIYVEELEELIEGL